MKELQNRTSLCTRKKTETSIKMKEKEKASLTQSKTHGNHSLYT